MGKGPAPFAGFEEPPRDVNAYSWKDRLQALYYEYRGQWAKYGPYHSSKTVNNAKSSVRNFANGLDVEIETHISNHEDGTHYLFVKVESNGVQGKG